MNIETGRIYSTPKSIQEARERGEHLVELSNREYQDVRGMNRKQRRMWAAEHKKRKCDQ